LGNEKTQGPINVKDVQKASNRSKWIKYLEHQVKESQVNVLDPKPCVKSKAKTFESYEKVIVKATVINYGNKLETNHDTPVPVPHGNKQSAVDIPLSQIPSQHYWGSSRVIVHESTLQNFVYANPRSPSIDASQETEASNINLDIKRKIPDLTMQGLAWRLQGKSIWIHPSAPTNLNHSKHQAISMRVQGSKHQFLQSPSKIQGQRAI
jgi:hypothetical protein